MMHMVETSRRIRGNSVVTRMEDGAVEKFEYNEGTYKALGVPNSP